MAEIFLDLETGDDVDPYPTCVLTGGEYGIDLREVREVCGWEPVNRLPNAPGRIKGGSRTRGDIVPVIDLRERFRREGFPTPVLPSDRGADRLPSVTTRASRQDVKWFVMREPFEIARNQVRRLVSLIGENARPTHPLSR